MRAIITKVLTGSAIAAAALAVDAKTANGVTCSTNEETSAEGGAAKDERPKENSTCSWAS